MSQSLTFSMTHDWNKCNHRNVRTKSFVSENNRMWNVTGETRGLEVHESWNHYNFVSHRWALKSCLAVLSHIRSKFVLFLCLLGLDFVLKSLWFRAATRLPLCHFVVFLCHFRPRIYDVDEWQDETKTIFFFFVKINFKRLGRTNYLWTNKTNRKQKKNHSNHQSVQKDIKAREIEWEKKPNETQVK